VCEGSEEGFDARFGGLDEIHIEYLRPVAAAKLAVLCEDIVSDLCKSLFYVAMF
jgi:hypothetical protein